MESGLEACADAKLLRIVLHNLLGNAWKFTSKMACREADTGAAEIIWCMEPLIRRA